MTNESGRDGAVVLPDGRRISYRCYGDPAGAPVLALHGTPGSRLKFSATDGPARALGLHVIAPDRWGYGGTHCHLKPSLFAFCDDMSALLDRLGCARVSVMGVSGGGPYATALGAHLGERVIAAALISPVGPIVRDAGDAPSLTLFHRLCFRGLPRAPAVTRAIFASYGWLLRRNPELAMRLAFLRAPRVDKQVIAEHAIRSRLAATFTEGLRSGAEGPVIDLGIFGRRWDVAMDDVAAHFGLWIGTLDDNVPVDAALRLAKSLRGCELSVLEGEGHLWVARNYGAVLGWIAEKQKGATSVTP